MNGQDVHAYITQDIRRTTGLWTRRLGLTLGVTLLVFVALLLASGYLRLWVGVSFQSESLNLTTAISTSLAVLVITGWVLRRAEKRWQGIATLRHLVRVLALMTRLETALKTEADEAELPEQTWQAYQDYLAVLGLDGT